MQALDLWLHQMDTEETLPLFEREAREYAIGTITDVDWSTEPEHLVRIAKHQDFTVLKEFQSEAQFTSVYHWLLERGESELLHEVFDYLAKSMGDCFVRTRSPAVVLPMVQFLSSAPYLAIHLTRMGDWRTFPTDLRDVLRESTPSILKAIVLSANQMQEFVVLPFKEVLSQVQHMYMSFFFELVELIALTVRSPDVALDLVLECLEPQTVRVLTERPAVVQLAVRSAIGIALDHIDEASQSHSQRAELLNLKCANGDPRSSTLECRLRIDAPSSGALMQGDHVRLTAASSPVNSQMPHPCSMDAQVLAYEPGFVKFRCLHPPPRFVEHCSWLLDNCGSFITCKTMFDAVQKFSTQLEQCSGVHQQILGLPGCHIEFSTKPRLRGDLNPSQNEAVQSSLFYPLTCLWGPPGTGKTHTIVAILRELLASDTEQRILVSAPTHNAVDNVLRKFLKEVQGKGEYDRPIRVSTEVSHQRTLHVVPSRDLFCLLVYVGQKSLR